jgi:coproporphyrinogen III oxidase-like Fe-S oxidoreductase
MLEGSSLIKKAQIEKIDTIYFGGGTPSLMPTKVLSVSHAMSGNIS